MIAALCRQFLVIKTIVKICSKLLARREKICRHTRPFPRAEITVAGRKSGKISKTVEYDTYQFIRASELVFFSAPCA